MNLKSTYLLNWDCGSTCANITIHSIPSFALTINSRFTDMYESALTSTVLVLYGLGFSISGFVAKLPQPISPKSTKSLIFTALSLPRNRLFHKTLIKRYMYICMGCFVRCMCFYFWMYVCLYSLPPGINPIAVNNNNNI
jgi:hypothetical protein